MTNEPHLSKTPKMSRDLQRDTWLELALELNQSGAWEYEVASDRLTWTQNCESLLGTLPQNYQQWLQKICPGDRETFSRNWRQAIQQQGSYKLEYRFMLPDGGVRWFEQRAKWAEGRDGPRLLGVFSAIERPTERPKALSPSLESIEQYQQVLDAIADLVLIKGPKSRIVWGNKAFRDFYGMSNEALRDLIDAPFNEPDYTLKYVIDDTRVFTTGETLVIPEEPVTRHDGKVMRFQTVKSAIRNSEGEVVFTVGVSRNLNEIERARAQRRQREGFLRNISSVLPGAIFQYRVNLANGVGRFTYASSTVEDLFELTVEEMLEINGPLWQIMHVEDVAKVQASIYRAVKANTGWSEEFRIITASGKEKWIGGKTEPLEAIGDMSYHNGIFFEISDRKALEQQLSEQQELLNAFISASPIGIAIVDAQTRYLQINESLAAINGLSVGEHIGKTIRELIQPNLVPQLEQICQQVLATGEPILGIEVTGERLGVPGDIRTQLVSYFPIRQSGTPATLIGIVTYDISDRKAAEAALAASEARHRAFIEAIPDLIFCLDRNCNFLDFIAPKSEPLLAPAEEIIGRNARDVLPDFLAEITETYAQLAFETKQLESFEYQLPMGARFNDYEARYVAASDEEVMVIIRNISDRKAAEAALAASEARNRAFIEAIPDLIFCLDRDGNYLDFIAPKLEPLPVSREELIGNNVRNVLPESLAERVLAYTQRVLETKQLEHFEYQLPIGDRIFDYEARYATVSDEEVMIIVRNISDRKQAEQERERLSTIIETTSDFVGSVDLQGRTLYINQAGRRMLGYAADEPLLGTAISQYRPPWATKILEKQGIPAAIRDGIWQGETALVSKDGREIPVSQVVIINKAPDGQPQSLSTIARDITDLKANEAKLKQKARLAAFRADVDAALTQEVSLSEMLSRCTETAVRHLQAAFTRIWTLNTETNILELQASSGLYTHLDGAHGRISVGEYKIGRIVATGEPHLTNNVSEDAAIDRDWAEREGIVAFAGYPLIVDSKAIGVIAMFARQPLPEATLNALSLASYEISLGIRRKQAEDDLRHRTQELERTLNQLQKTQAQLIQTEKMSSLGQMVAGVAHEINNPINFIHGNISHAKAYATDLIDLIKLYRKTYSEPTPEIKEIIDDIELDFLMHDLSKLLLSMKVGSDRIRQIVVSLRNFSRLDEAEMKPVNLHEGIDSTLLVLQHRLKNIQVHRDYVQLPPVECYAGQLNQVLLNILSNAIDVLESRSPMEIKDSDGLAQITISTEQISENWVAISITDNGPGISEAVRQKLFDPFFTTKPVGKGTGLGLSISYQIVVEKHGGHLECSSVLGQGTTLRIEIPIQQLED